MAITSVGENAAFSCWRDRAVPALQGNGYSSPIGWLRDQAANDGHIASHNDTEFPPTTTFATTQSIEALRRGWLPVAYQSPKLCP
jgi:hypothetical protein